MLNVAIIGFGGIAKSQHFPACRALEKEGLIKLVAICDLSKENIAKQISINTGDSDDISTDGIALYTDWKELLENEKLDLVDICLPTYLHAEVTIAALNKGCNVMCEKPMSLSYQSCLDMISAAKNNGRKLMIGLCLRFSPKYLFLKKAIDENLFGKVKSASFNRLSGPPIWGWDNWFLTYEKSHGCLNDMHIHDIDMSRFLFGEPVKVSCHAQKVYCEKDIAHSTLVYPDFSVLAVGDWSHKGTNFRADYCVSFEEATVILNGNVVTVYPRNGEPYVPEETNSTTSNHYNELKFFVEHIVENKEITVNSPESAALTEKLIEALIESSDKQGEYLEFKI